ncbi:MAG: hypothetical protein GF308_17915 [Candidatus Heimdallarchaeota archaeon]|nr:hypothetical protein [Candidatus Heimdallarchaeota archaeon]
MSFIKDLFNSWFSTKEDGDPQPISISEKAGEEIFYTPKELEKFQLCLCLSSFTDKGMAISAKGDCCNKNLPDDLLTIIANYSGIFSQQSQGEHLFGPLPLPHSSSNKPNQKINFDEWYLLIYVFEGKNKKISDPRIVYHGHLTPSQFLICYPRQFDNIVIQSKNKITKILRESSGVSKDINSFDDQKLSTLESEIKTAIIGQITKPALEQKSPFSNIAQFKMSAEYRLMTINERLGMLISLIQGLTQKPNQKTTDQEKSEVKFGILFCTRLSDVITTLQYHVPPLSQLDGTPWKILHSTPEIISLQLSNIQLWFLTPKQLPTVFNEALGAKIPIGGLYFGIIENLDKTTNSLNDYFKQISKVEFGVTVGLNNNVHENQITKIIKQKVRPKKGERVFSKTYIPSDSKGVFAQILWYYDLLIGQLMGLNRERQKEMLSEEDLLSKEERKDIKGLFSKSLGEQ